MAFNFDAEESEFDTLLDENENDLMMSECYGGDAPRNDQFETPELDEELAKLESLAAVEREELNELVTACEELDQAIENERVYQKLEQQCTKIDCLVDEFANSLDNLEHSMNSVRDDHATAMASIKRYEEFVSLHDNECRDLTVKKNEILEDAAAKTREIMAMKKTAENRHGAEIKDLNDDIKSTRPIICEVEKTISDERIRLNTLEEEAAKGLEELEQAKNALDDSYRNFESLQKQVEDLKEHGSEEVETLATEISIMEAKLDSIHLSLETFCKGETAEHEQYEALKQRIEECREEKGALKQKIVAHQKKSEKRLDSRMTELKGLNRQLSDVMDSLNLARQKEYAERLDYDYLLSKNELDFEKLAGSADQKLSDFGGTLKSFKRQVDEVRELKRQVARLRTQEAEKDETRFHRKTKTS